MPGQVGFLSEMAATRTCQTQFTPLFTRKVVICCHLLMLFRQQMLIEMTFFTAYIVTLETLKNRRFLLIQKKVMGYHPLKEKAKKNVQKIAVFL
jgi:hypothetical protein